MGVISEKDHDAERSKFETLFPELSKIFRLSFHRSQEARDESLWKLIQELVAVEKFVEQRVDLDANVLNTELVPGEVANWVKIGHPPDTCGSCGKKL